MDGAVSFYLYCLAGQADYSLDPIELGLIGCLEDDDVASTGVVSKPIGCFVY